jgi:hypothetical protein
MEVVVVKCRILDTDFLTGEIKIQVEDPGKMVVSTREHVLVESASCCRNFIEWLAHGERGISAETIATKISGIDCLRNSRGAPPHDADDFGRCERLLREVPEFRPYLHTMAEVSAAWAKLVQAWPELVELYDDGQTTSLTTKMWSIRP